MSLFQLLLILRARWWIIAGSLLAGIAGAIALNVYVQKQYTAVATVVVDSRMTDAVTGALLPAPVMSTQLEIIRSQRVALLVVDATKLVQSPMAQRLYEEKTEGKGSIRHWWADRLLLNTEVQLRRDSNLVDIRFTAPDPRFAALIANSFARAYVDATLALTLDPARQTASFFDEQMMGLRENLEKAQSRLSLLQQKYGIVAAEERLDAEHGRLEELYGQLAQVQGDARDSLTRQDKAMEFGRGGSAPENVPDVLANPLVQSIKADLLKAEARLQEISAMIGVNHPQHQRQVAEIAALRQKLEQEIRATAAGMATMSAINLQREADLRRAVDEQKRKMLQLKEQHDEITVLRGEAESAQRAYDAAQLRYTQTSLASRTSQTNVVILNPAVEPIESSSPRVFRNLLVGLIAGFIAGLNLAVVVEVFDRRVRSNEDLSADLALPVLGSIAGRAEARRIWRFPGFGRLFTGLKLGRG